MPVCPKCDIVYSDDKNYCIRCGTPLVKTPVREEKKPVKEEQRPKIQLEVPALEGIHTPEVLRLKKPRKSKTILMIISLFVVIAITVVIFLFIPKMYKKVNPPVRQDEEILELVNKAREYLDADKLITPSGENALEVAEKILAKEPGNEDALRIKKEIIEKYTQWGDENYYKQNFEKAISHYKKALSIDDENIQVREKIVQAERMIEEQKILEETNRKIAEQKRLSELNIYLPLFNNKVVEKAVSLGYTPFRVMFLDNFESNENKWPVEDIPNGPYLNIKNGYLVIEERTEEQAYWVSKELEQNDFIVRYTLKYESGADDNGAGIFFRAKSFNDYRYFISLDATGDCYYQVGYYDSPKKKWVEMNEWTKSDTIRSKEDNKVEAIVTGDKIYLFINGEFINSVSGLKNTSGNIFGFFCAVNGMRYSFDDLCFIELRKRS